MATASLGAESRTDKGKGVARKLRHDGKIPGVIYGHGRAPQSLVVNTRDTERMLTGISAASTVIELTMDGKTVRTLIREIQRHPFKRHILHIDFQELVAGEKVTVNIPLRFVGIAEGVRNSGGVLEEVMHQLHIRLDPVNIPDHIDVDVTNVAVGHSLHVRDLTLPEGLQVLDDEGATVAVVAIPKTVVEAVVATEAVAGEAPAEPELIRKTKADEDAEEKK
jgi:large subunit ribosomal protein L25